MHNLLKYFNFYDFESIVCKVFGKLEYFFCRYLHSYLFRGYDVREEFFPISGYFFRVATFGDIDGLSNFVVDKGKIFQRMERGDICFVAVRECDGCIVSALWTATGLIYSQYTGSCVDTGDDGFLIYAGKTLEEEMSKGLYRSLLAMAVSYYKKNGRYFVYGIVDRFNTKSLAIKKKYGFCCIGESYYFKLLFISITYYKKWYICVKKVYIYAKVNSCRYKFV